MAVFTHRGPIGLDGFFSPPMTDRFDRFLYRSEPLPHEPDANRGPLAVGNAGSRTMPSRALPQQAFVPSAHPAQNLSPVEYADLFHNVRVDYFHPESGMANSVTINVHIYNNNGIEKRRGNMIEKSILNSAIRLELRNANGLGLISVKREHRAQVAHCFYGKGDPDEYRVTLMHALRYGRATPGNLQNYCDRVAKLGLDCSGFVNSYFKHIGRITESRHIDTYERGFLRSAEREIRGLDVLIWQLEKLRHIAVVDHVIAGTDPLKMVVVESSGSKEGLSTSVYTVLSVKNQIFRVDRGPRPDGKKGGKRQNISSVKIAQVS